MPQIDASALTDALLRASLRIEQLATGTLADMVRTIDAALADVAGTIASTSGDTFTSVRLYSLRATLHATRAALDAELEARLLASLDAVLDT